MFGSVCALMCLLVILLVMFAYTYMQESKRENDYACQCNTNWEGFDSLTDGKNLLPNHVYNDLRMNVSRTAPGVDIIYRELNFQGMPIPFKGKTLLKKSGNLSMYINSMKTAKEVPLYVLFEIEDEYMVPHLKKYAFAIRGNIHGMDKFLHNNRVKYSKEAEIYMTPISYNKFIQHDKLEHSDSGLGNMHEQHHDHNHIDLLHAGSSLSLSSNHLPYSLSKSMHQIHPSNKDFSTLMFENVQYPSLSGRMPTRLQR
jgi:hypothetical protein